MQKEECTLLKHKCPECGEISVHDFYPFCSAHCRSVDLSRWLSDGYRIAGKEDDMFSEEVEEDS
ncbi:MAG: DNA gyrase inhibitor YacG [Candidatus Liberibacter ctenarytainae]|uniref:DNA gyrase inhibitor YacG n=1 Tax=Candidatus Liberibacter ctenarytainae TaxID=2020335 RepID=A0A937ARL7_9HYPH|nr:DNA gyrase inhibitor YacG [Candidatus Liberibacter ctenarytainae]